MLDLGNVKELRKATGPVAAFYDAAREAGMGFSEDALARCRVAVSNFLGRSVYPRTRLSRLEWRLCTAAIRSGQLVW